MIFDFDKYIDRTQTGSMKWSFPERYLSPEQAAANPLPLWVADMDFRSPQEIIEAIKNAAEHNIMGYSAPTQNYIEALCNWQQQRFNWAVDPDWIIQTPGVVTALNTAIQAFTQPGDSVLVQPPVYVHFHEDTLFNHRTVAFAPLTLKEGRYTFDPEVFEKAIRPDTRLFILCNPHNPTGNVWSEEDLRTMATICRKHNILVISDEIHQDLIFNRTVKHFTYARLGQEFANQAIICTAPSKTFNIAGLQVSNLFIPNPDIRARFKEQMTRNGINLVNCLGMAACEAAYRHGTPWLEAVLDYIGENQTFLRNELATALPQLKVTPTDALFLTWIDFRALNMNAEELMTFLTTKARVWFDDGRKFGAEGHGFMRVNVGCPRARLAETVQRIKDAVAHL